MLLCAAIVSKVSASWVRTAPSRFSWSVVSRQARALAMAVIEAVSSHGFTKIPPGVLYAGEGVLGKMNLNPARTKDGLLILASFYKHNVVMVLEINIHIVACGKVKVHIWGQT